MHESLGLVHVDGQEERPLVALDGVGDLDVVDVDEQVRGGGGDAGQRTGLVADQDAQVREVVGVERAAGQLATGRGGARETALEDVTVKGAFAEILGNEQTLDAPKTL